MLVPRPKPLVAQNGNPPAVPSTVARAVVMRSESYSGPVAHPSIAQGWESVVPGAADRILGMAERQAAHRQAIEKWSVLSRSLAQPLGSILGAALGIAAIVAGYNLLMADKSLEGFSVIVAGLGPLIWAYAKETGDKKK